MLLLFGCLFVVLSDWKVDGGGWEGTGRQGGGGCIGVSRGKGEGWSCHYIIWEDDLRYVYGR